MLAGKGVGAHTCFVQLETVEAPTPILTPVGEPRRMTKPPPPKSRLWVAVGGTASLPHSMLSQNHWGRAQKFLALSPYSYACFRHTGENPPSLWGCQPVGANSDLLLPAPLCPFFSMVSRSRRGCRWCGGRGARAASPHRGPGALSGSRCQCQGVFCCFN